MLTEMELDLEHEFVARAYPILASLVTAPPIAFVSRTWERFEMIRHA